MNTLQEVASYLHQALNTLLTAVGVRPISPENWPAPFRFLDENIEWPPVRVCSVVQKPDQGLCMLIAFYDHSLGDIAIAYINERQGFSTLCKAFAHEDGPFFMEACSRLEELRCNAEWQRSVHGIHRVPAVHGPLRGDFNRTSLINDASFNNPPAY